MSKKMCKNWGKENHLCIRCPKNTNDYCEIIPAKPKHKTIKGWARWSIDGEMFVVTGKYDDNTIPCEIRINTKYLKEKK